MRRVGGLLDFRGQCNNILSKPLPFSRLKIGEVAGARGIATTNGEGGQPGLVIPASRLRLQTGREGTAPVGATETPRQSRGGVVQGDVFFDFLLTWASFLARCSSTFRLSSLLP